MVYILPESGTDKSDNTLINPGWRFGCIPFPAGKPDQHISVWIISETPQKQDD